MHNGEYSRLEQLEDKPADIVVDKADVAHILCVEDVGNRLFVEVARSKSCGFEVFEEGYEDQRSSFAEADLEGR